MLVIWISIAGKKNFSKGEKDMFILGNFLIAIGRVLHIVIYFFYFVIIIAAVLSWLRPNPYHPVINIIYRLSDIIVNPIRRFVPPLGFVDISPFITLLILYFIDLFIVRSIIQLGYMIS